MDDTISQTQNNTDPKTVTDGQTSQSQADGGQKPAPASSPLLDRLRQKREEAAMNNTGLLGQKPSLAVPPKDPHQENLKLLQEYLGDDRVKENELMSKHTTFRIGGPAEFFFEAESVDDLIRAVTFCREDKFLKKDEDITEEDLKRLATLEKQKAMTASNPKGGAQYASGRSSFGSRFGKKKEPKYQLPFFILGGGSNILVSDQGIKGLVIKVKTVKVNIGGEIVEAYAGTPTGYVLQQALKADLSGMEFLDGVPGTIGGAVYNNVKAFFLGDFLEKPKSISEILYDFMVITKDGKVINRKKEDYEWHLTHNNISEKGDVILVVRLKLSKGVSQEAKDYLEQYKALRMKKPYMKYPSAGSVFRNPTGYISGKLIDECGLKGERRGDAQISEEHGNIFVNTGEAKAAEVRELIELAKSKVKEKFGVDIHEEIRYIGEYRSEREIEEAKQKAQEDTEQDSAASVETSEADEASELETNG